jgi:hypothetical protein
MMTLPSPDVLDELIQERQRALRRSQDAGIDQRPSPMRVRIGHALIAAGAALSGERLEHTGARPVPHAA